MTHFMSHAEQEAYNERVSRIESLVANLKRFPSSRDNNPKYYAEVTDEKQETERRSAKEAIKQLARYLADVH